MNKKTCCKNCLYKVDLSTENGGEFSVCLFQLQNGAFYDTEECINSEGELEAEVCKFLPKKDELKKKYTQHNFKELSIVLHSIMNCK